jgi:hypothetical protein
MHTSNPILHERIFCAHGVDSTNRTSCIKRGGALDRNVETGGHLLERHHRRELAVTAKAGEQASRSGSF